ncbi:MAG: hypothetical protein ACYTG2_09265 [Planctomycetota bacterium]|jgi:hypothetical protein
MSWRATLALGVLVPALTAGGCAWANRDNRPVWNAFEQHLVSEDDTLFYVSLPLTVPGGFIAILLDTFLVHPAQVVDDSLGDAGDLWEEMAWERRYYTEMVKLPLRTVGTPLVFVLSFLGRSAFDIPPYESKSPEDKRRRAEERDRERTQRWLSWLQALADGGLVELGHVPVPTWTAELDEAFRLARERATATGRLFIYDGARRERPPPWVAEPWMGLTDVDPAIRYLELERLKRPGDVPPSVREALRADESALVRERARQLWP